MLAPLDCPEIECWQALFADNLNDAERERFERHLESCPTCQERAHRAEEEDELRRLGRALGDPTIAPADPTLAGILERLHDSKPPEPRPSQEPVDLYFLRPSDRPDLLGVLGSYEVQEVIGQGGMGVVLKAFDPALHRLVAIKVMAAAVAGSATARKRFEREAKAAAAVSHDHIVTVHGVHEADGLPYLVMQFIAGESLQDRLDRDGPLEVTDVVRIGLQTASALAAAHAQGLIHRDIKPANILLENGVARVKITDFGLARMVDFPALTQSGVLAGTPEYMAPEQARGEQVDHRADLFSLGSVLYAMCTGAPPFGGSTTVAVIRRVIDEAPLSIREQNPDVPAWLETLIHRLLAKDAKDRFQCAAEVATLLETYLAHLRQPATVAAPQLPTIFAAVTANRQKLEAALSLAKRKPHWRKISLLAVAALLLPAFPIWLLLGFLQPDDPPPNEPPPNPELKVEFPAAAVKAAARRPLQDHVGFRFAAEWDQRLLSYFGPDAASLAKIDDQGLRFVIPADRALPASGVLSQLRLRGDFDVMLEYELLGVPNPGPPRGCGVQLLLLFDSRTIPRAQVWRMQRSNGPMFGAGYNRVDADGKEQYKGFEMVPAAAATGKLRLERAGGRLLFQVADGETDFRQIAALEAGGEDVVTVRAQYVTGGTPEAVDLRFIALDLGADSIPNKPGSRQALLALGILFLILFLCSLGLWWYRRHSHRSRIAAEPNSVSDEPAQNVAGAALIGIQCSACGKSVRVKAQLAGKRVKCPHCAAAILVPAIKAADPRP